MKKNADIQKVKRINWIFQKKKVCQRIYRNSEIDAYSKNYNQQYSNIADEDGRFLSGFYSFYLYKASGILFKIMMNVIKKI